MLDVYFESFVNPYEFFLDETKYFNYQSGKSFESADIQLLRYSQSFETQILHVRGNLLSSQPLMISLKGFKLSRKFSFPILNNPFTVNRSR